jgi:hypothetical protein
MKTNFRIGLPSHINGCIAERAYELGAIDTSLPLQNSGASATSTIALATRTTIPRSRASSGKAFRGYLEFRITKMATALEAIG